MKRKVFTLLGVGMGMILHATTAVYDTVTVTSGGLFSALTATQLSTVTDLTIKGSISSSDFVTMRDKMPVLANIDISESSVDYNAIPQYAFYSATTYQGSDNLLSIKLPSTITSIGSYAFDNCNNLSSINLPNSITTIGDYSFYGCAFTTLTLPSSLTTIGNNCFQYCQDLTSFIMPSTVTSVGWDMCNACSSLTDVVISSSLTKIAEQMFSKCSSLTSITIPTSIKSIDIMAFQECTALKSVIIPSSVTTIVQDAFAYCSALQKVSIPASVTSIGSDVFYGCTSLDTVYSYRTTPVNITSSSNVFGNVNKSTCILYVPSSSVSQYKAANQWQDFTTINGTLTDIEIVKSLTKSYKIEGNTIVFTDKNTAVYSLLGQRLSDISCQNITLPNGVYFVQTPSGTTKIVLTK